MFKLMRFSVFQIGALLCLATTVLGQPSDPCALALTETGRNRIYESSDDERFSLAYQWSCRTNDTQHGLDTNFKMSKMIDGSSAGRYAQREDFCKTELSRFESRQATRVQKSLVVERALDNWLSCQSVTRKKLTVTPFVSRAQAVITFERTGSAKGMIRGVHVDNGTVCSGQVQVAGSPEFQNKTFDHTFAYQLPVEETFTMTCVRKAQPSKLPEGTAVYPETTITVVTSESPLVLKLDAEPVASETWASEIKRAVDAQAAELKEQSTRFLSELKAIEAKIPTRIEVREGKNLGWGPNHNGYDKTCVKEGLNQVAISTMAGTDRGEIGVLCGSLHLQPELKK